MKHLYSASLKKFFCTANRTKKLHLILLHFFFLFSFIVNAQADHLVISQVYGGGGNSGATYKNDFIEIFNPTSSTVNLTGWSVQYASSSGSSWQVTPLSGSIAPGQYYLVQQRAGTGGTVDLPTPDATGTIAMAGTSGKVALVNSTTASTGTCPTTGVIDFVGFGSTNCFEGSGGTATLSNTTAAIRENNGCTETNDNAADFSTGAPTPRNTSSGLNSCSVSNTSISVAAGSNAAEPSTKGSFTLNFSAATTASTTIDYAFSGSTDFGTDYTISFSAGTTSSSGASATLTVPAGTSSITITVTPVDDILIEGSENIILTISNPAAGYIISTSNAGIDLNDNDVPSIPAGTVVINELYGGGGNGGSTFTNDFVELYNNSNTAVILDGWSIQYASAGGNFTQKVELNGSIPAKGYYLIQLSAGSGGTTALPTPDASGGISMSATSGKLALVNNETLLGSTCTGSQIMDLVGFGASANCYEGSGPTPAPSNSTSVQRNPKGFDTDNNATDFVVRSMPSPMNSVGDLIPPVVTSLFPGDNASGVLTSFNAIINFSEAVTKGTGNILLKKSDGTIVQSFDVSSDAVRVSSSTASFHIQSLEFNTSYYFEVPAGAFSDLFDNDFAGINDATTWNFTTASAPPSGVIDNTYSFNTCNGNLSDGFTSYSVTGSIVWECTPFGREPGNTTASAPNGVQINGFNGTTNIPNEDWLISPAFDLTGTTYPLLSFWSRTAFNGAPLQLKISTDYSGTGDPNNATWTDLNGKFPNVTSNVWTESNNINLSAYKQPKVFIAWVYNSTDDDGARWTVDDIKIENSATPPPPTITVSTNDVQFGFVAAGSAGVKTFNFTGNDITGDVTLTATGNFMLSKDGNSFSNSITYSQADANNIITQVYVQFAPTANNENYTGTITVETSGLSAQLNLKGTSIDPATTLEVVNWNIEWFGSNTMGPTNDPQQLQNVKKILTNINADIYALTEIVDETALANLVSQLEGYSYVISNYGSHTNTAVNPPTAIASAQKLAFVYKTSVINNLGVRPMLSQGLNTLDDARHPYYGYWASGRFPYLMDAQVTLNCVTTNVKFVLVHAKANTAPTDQSYNRRKAGAGVLRDSLNILFPDDNIIILGDFNDDLDQSITDGFTTTSWSSFTTSADYEPITLQLSLEGKKSTVSYNDVIDHVVVSDEMQQYYMSSTAAILTDVTSLVSNYGSTTSDHYPVFSRYMFDKPAAPQIDACPVVSPVCESNNSIYNIPTISATGCGNVNYSYTISGATNRSGNTNDASGFFENGTNIITWTVSNDFGNSSTCQTTVVINQNPTVVIPDAYALSAGVLPNTVYTGYAPASSIVLNTTVSGGGTSYNYVWSNRTTGASLEVSPTSATTYTVTVTDNNGCTATASKEINVIDVRAGKKMDKVMICHKPAKQANTLEVADNAVAAHLAHGDMLGSCSDNTPSITVRNANEENLIKGFAIKALPNPSSNYFIINIDSDQKELITIRVTDLLGRTIEQKNNIQAQTIKIGQDYKPGIYIVEIMQGSTHKQLKLVKTTK